MTSIRPFEPKDLFRFNAVNFDRFTETVRRWQAPLKPAQRCWRILMHARAQFGVHYYLSYLARWPEYCWTSTGPNGNVTGYIFGKAEGEGQNWHGHVTAVTVAPEHRQAGSGCVVQALTHVQHSSGAAHAGGRAWLAF